MVDSRRERRRATDREAQRASRARTKKRIEELEGTVQSLLVGHADERVSLLCRQLDEQRQKNGELTSGLVGIRKILENVEKRHQIGNDPKDPAGQSPVASGPRSSSPDLAVEQQSIPLVADVARSLDPSSIPALSALSGIDPGEALESLLPILGLLHSNPLGLGQSPQAELSGESRQQKPENWRVVNAVLATAIRELAQVPLANTASDSDIPIRAVLHGWAETKSLYALDTGWQVLQQIDQFLFFQCGPIARLAILRLMRLQLMQHAKPAEMREVMPTFMRSKASSQKSSYPVLVDFFPWPIVRDHMLCSPSTYANNSFGKKFSENVRFHWHANLNDVCTLSPSTGTFVFTETFNTRFYDVRSWALSGDFFSQYPQLVGMIPIYNALPPSLTPAIPSDIMQRAHEERVQGSSSGMYVAHASALGSYTAQHAPIGIDAAEPIDPALWSFGGLGEYSGI